VPARTATFLILALVLDIQGQVQSRRPANTRDLQLVDQSGNIQKPRDIENSYETLGTDWTLDATSGDRISSTYATNGTAEVFRGRGVFPDGTVLVRQVVGTEHDGPDAKRPYLAPGTVEWFVMIKESTRRFRGKPQWGEGWGWARFRSDRPDARILVDYKKDCAGCHVRAKSTDWIFVSNYEKLRMK
jgi:hypothetical protein